MMSPRWYVGEVTFDVQNKNYHFRTDRRQGDHDDEYNDDDEYGPC